MPSTCSVTLKKTRSGSRSGPRFRGSTYSTYATRVHKACCIVHPSKSLNELDSFSDEHHFSCILKHQIFAILVPEADSILKLFCLGDSAS